MSLAKDYIGRVVDIAAFREVNLEGVTTPKQSFLDDESGGEVITGIRKLVQRFLLELLLEEGTMKYQKTRGCGFIKKLRNGSLITETSIFQAFGISESKIRGNLVSEENSSTPLDERYLRSEILSIKITSNGTFIAIKIVSRAGASRVIIMPITSLIP